MSSIIGFETTCDDTGVAIIDEKGCILSNELETQMKKHLWNGGIIPMVAKELHVEAIDIVANRAFKKSGLNSIEKDIQAVAVANRPGLYHSIQVGLNYAKSLANKYSKPLIPVHHMQAHALTPLIEHRGIKFPFITLLLSGGHCILAIVKRFNDFHILGQTRDDAPGDILDKFARRFRLRNLGPPFDNMSGGAAIELLATRGDRFRYFNNQTTVPRFKGITCDFSFSGYRGSYEQLTPIIDELWLSGDRERLTQELADICASLQRVFLVQIVKRLHRALGFFRMHWRYKNEDAFSDKNEPEHMGFGIHDIDLQQGTESVDLVLSGGVAANKYIVEGIRKICDETSDFNMNVYSPSKGLANDNGLMIAWNGLLHYRNYIRSPSSTIVLNDPKSMNGLFPIPDCPLGLDISNQLKLTGFGLKSVKHPEIRLG